MWMYILLVTNQYLGIPMSAAKAKGLRVSQMMKKFIAFYNHTRLNAERRLNRLPLSSEDVSGELSDILYRSSPPSLR